VHDLALTVEPGPIVYRFDAPLVFVNTAFFYPSVRAAVVAYQAQCRWGSQGSSTPSGGC